MKQRWRLGDPDPDPEDILARIEKGYYEAKAKAEAEAAKQKALEQARREKVVQFPHKLAEQELIRRQAVIDAHWQRMLDERAELERQANACCHRGPGDPDWSA